jgi:hypothetical protein
MRAAGMEGDVGDISKRESTTEGSMYGGSEVRNAVHCSSGLSSKRASSNRALQQWFKQQACTAASVQAASVQAAINWKCSSPQGAVSDKCIELARTIYIYIRCIYGVLSREITKFTVKYGVYVRFWPTLQMQWKMANYSLQKCVGFARIHRI